MDYVPRVSPPGVGGVLRSSRTPSTLLACPYRRVRAREEPGLNGWEGLTRAKSEVTLSGKRVKRFSRLER